MCIMLKVLFMGFFGRFWPEICGINDPPHNNDISRPKGVLRNFLGRFAENICCKTLPKGGCLDSERVEYPEKGA